mgnify:CR=1 FL=1
MPFAVTTARLGRLSRRLMAYGYDIREDFFWWGPYAGTYGESARPTP